MIIKKITNFIAQLTSTRAAGLYLLMFAIAIGVATFIENDFGTSSAQAVVFRSWWFELLLLLFCITIIMNVWRFKLIKQKKWASVLFHLSIVLILIGSAVTRYYGTEGMMHIREGETSNQYLSAEPFIKFRVHQGGKSYAFDEPVYFSSLGSNSFENSYQIGNSLIEVKLDEFVPNPTETLTPDANGVPILKVVFGGMGGREEYMLRQGDRTNINGVNFNFSAEYVPDAFNITLNGDSLSFLTQENANQQVMATQQVDDLTGGVAHPIKLRSLYTLQNASFVFGHFMPKAKAQIAAGKPKITNESTVGLNLTVAVNGKPQKTMVSGQKGDVGQPKSLIFGETEIEISYGSKIEELPFSLTCRDFILEKYPGTENPSSYASEVTLIDAANAVNREQRIYMNNILDYGGFRFFQSSFDQDELGTYLSVNFDFWGTWISYIGYILLTIGLLMTFFDKKSRFTYLLKKLDDSHTNATALFILVSSIMFGNIAMANPTNPISKEHAASFGRLMVQDHNGRIKPVNTYTGELLRKVSRAETLLDQNSDQLVLSMMLNPSLWEKASIIQVPNHPDIRKILGTEEKLVSYSSFFGPDGTYKFQDQIKAAQAMIPKEQGVFEKAVIKLDEKVNIVNMIFSGSILRFFPQKNDSTNTWLTPAEILHNHASGADNSELKTLFLNYLQTLSDGLNSGDYKPADAALAQISSYQKINGGSVLPSEAKLKAELFLNKLDIFSRLKGYYGILCLVFTGVFLYTTIKRKSNKINWLRYALIGMLFGFIFHTLGLGLRWYVSGRAPWSNGYESMIYIGWTTMLAGTLFSRKSLGGLAATATLAATIMFVASMSWLDPEITPLVPVLKSYWLTIHVSLEAGSYGFLLLGAVLGMLNLVLMVFIKESNKDNILRAIKELTIISEITLLGGLAMISIGTYLGGVWANESWGRYWGWDAKETWALVTILVYAFILHMRFIPKLQGVFAFNFASLFGFATVIMTYLGVNYYLSGLHSYAAGDPVPIPPAVYYTTISLIVLSILAFRNFKKVNK